MPIAIFQSKKEMSLTIKEMTKICLNNSKSPRILFPTGTTPLGEDGYFAALLDAKQKENLETSRIRLVSGDEYYGKSVSDPGSFATYLRTKVMEPLDMDISMAHMLNGQTSNPKEHCDQFESSLHKDPCSLAVLGLGTNGHVAFNDPPSLLNTTTRILNLTSESILSSKNDFPNVKDIKELPNKALSVGLKTLTSNCVACCVLVVGKKKAEIVKKVLEHNEYQGPNVPASQLRNSNNFLFCLDEEAASLLSNDVLLKAIQCQNINPSMAAKMLYSSTSRTIVNGDIGGTNARMQIWDVLNSGHSILRQDVRYKSKHFNNGVDLIHAFLKDVLYTSNETVDALSLAICGPVSNETIQCGPTLPEQGPTGWGFDITTLLSSTAYKVKKVKLINDFVSVGIGVSELPASDIITLHTAANAENHGTKCAVGAGTGLGAVFMTYDTKCQYYNAHPSEGGMAEFSAQTNLQWKLRNYIIEKYGYCTVESVISGPGLVNCFDFTHSNISCDSSSNGTKGSSVLDGVERANAPERIIQGVADKDEICMKALNLFINCFACHLRLTALQTLPTGGLYICGGIPCRSIVLNEIKNKLSPGLFIEDIVMGEYLSNNISLHIIINDDVGVLGSKIRSLRLLKENVQMHEEEKQ
jgi:glucokinase